jgi:hypothetical protein
LGTKTVYRIVVRDELSELYAVPLRVGDGDQSGAYGTYGCDHRGSGERFEIQVAGERIYVPSGAEFNVEHEREGEEEEIEFQLKWTNR